jgi:hypothetical protein
MNYSKLDRMPTWGFAPDFDLCILHLLDSTYTIAARELKLSLTTEKTSKEGGLRVIGTSHFQSNPIS